MTEYMPDNYIPGTLKQNSTTNRSGCSYAVAIQSRFDDRYFAILHGPATDVKLMLEIEGGYSNSVIVKYEGNGSCEIIYRWNIREGQNSCWVKVK